MDASLKTVLVNYLSCLLGMSLGLYLELYSKKIVMGLKTFAIMEQ